MLLSGVASKSHMGPRPADRNTRMGETMATVDFIYGLGSRYSYLAATQLARIERETGATFRWRPLSSSRLIGRRADDPFAAKAGGQYDWDYRRRDSEAWALPTQAGKRTQPRNRP